MTKDVAYVTTDEHPIPPELAEEIWGINICRTAADVEGAPEPIVRAFHMFTTDNTYTRCCGCGTDKMGKAGGIAVLRTNVPGQKFIGLGICSKCLEETDSTKITQRIFKTLTGQDKKSVDWKKGLQ